MEKSQNNIHLKQMEDLNEYNQSDNSSLLEELDALKVQL